MTHSEKWETAKRVFAKVNPDKVSRVFRGFYVPTTPQKDGEEDAKEREVKGNMEYPSEEETLRGAGSAAEGLAREKHELTLDQVEAIAV